jgi:hypothetical protein
MGCYLFYKDRNVDPKLPHGVETCQSVIMMDRCIAADATSVSVARENKFQNKAKQSKDAQPVVGVSCNPPIQRTFVVCVQSLRSEE